MIAKTHGTWRRVLYALRGVMACASLCVPVRHVVAEIRQDQPAVSDFSPRTVSLKAGQSESLSLGGVMAGETYGLVVTLESGRLAAEDRVQIELAGIGSHRLTKELHAGDPDAYFPVSPASGRRGPARTLANRERRRC